MGEFGFAQQLYPIFCICHLLGSPLERDSSFLLVKIISHYSSDAQLKAKFNCYLGQLPNLLLNPNTPRIYFALNV